MFGGVGAGESLGANPCLKICYAGYGHPFILLLEEQGVINDSQIRTREPEDPLDFNFANANVISKIIIVNILVSVRISLPPSDITVAIATKFF